MLVRELGSIVVEGKCFSAKAELKLFENSKHRMTFIFGRNGSGKSTLSKAIIAKQKQEPLLELSEFFLANTAGDVLEDELDVLHRTHVFNEDFVANKVQVDADGLGAIVMLGETGDLKSQIEKENKESKRIQDEIDRKESSLQDYNDAANPLSPTYHQVQVRNSLAGTDHWSDRERVIKSLQRAAPVSDAVVARICRLPLPDETTEELATEIENGTSRLKQLDSEAEMPALPCLDAALVNFDESHILSLLSLKIEHPELSERENRLLEIVESFGTTRLNESDNYFSDEAHTYCPYCFRDISATEKDSLSDSVQLVLNEDAKRHEQELDSIILPVLDMDLSCYHELSSEIIEKINTTILSINQALEILSKAIATKKNTLCAPQTLEPVNVYLLINQLEENLGQLEELRDKWNTEIKTKGSAIEKLQKTNEKLARIEIDTHINHKQAQKSAKEKIEADLVQLGADKRACLSHIATLENKMSNINVALDAINNGLSFIFLDNERLKLEGKNGEYHLISHGSAIKPSEVSAGERNAVALCYFFIMLGEGKDAEKAFSEEMFLFIDDPVSSFDQDNRIGILSYLRQQFKSVLSANKYSKIVCLTHDGYSMNAFEKMCKELSKIKVGDVSVKYPKTFSLEEGKLGEWHLNNMRYSELVNTIYNYSTAPSASMRPYIGNVTRKALEAFAMFEFGLGLSEFADSPKVLDRIKDTSTRRYFDSLMYHLVLHSESHTADPVQVEGIIEVNPEYTPDAIDEICKDSLCLMYCINEEHILNHIEAENASQVLSDWREAISNKCTLLS